MQTSNSRGAAAGPALQQPARDYLVQKNAPQEAGRRMKKPKYFEVSEEVRQREAGHNAKSGAEAIERVMNRTNGVNFIPAAMHDSDLVRVRWGILILFGENRGQQRRVTLMVWV